MPNSLNPHPHPILTFTLIFPKGNPLSTVKKVELKLPKGYHPRAALLPKEPHVLTKKAIGGLGGAVELKA